MNLVPDNPNEGESVELLPRGVPAVPVHGGRLTQGPRDTQVQNRAEGAERERADRQNEEECVNLLPQEVPVEVGSADAERADCEKFVDCAVGAVDRLGLICTCWYMISMMIIDVLVLMRWGGQVVAVLIALQVLVGVVLAVRILTRTPAQPLPPPIPEMPDTIAEIMNRRVWRRRPVVTNPEDLREEAHSCPALSQTRA